jgi:hypothetical protein
MVAGTTDQQRLFADVAARAPGVVQSIVQAEFFATATEFLEQTTAWQENINFQTVVGTNVYPLTIQEGYATIFKLLFILDANGYPVGGGGFMPAPQFGVVGSVAPVGNTAMLAFQNMPAMTQTCTATVALLPIDPVDINMWAQVPAWILQRWRKDFIDGVLGRLLSQPSKPYSNSQMSIYHLRRWRNAIGLARSEIRRSFTDRGQEWFFPQSWQTVRNRGSFNSATFGAGGNSGSFVPSPTVLTASLLDAFGNYTASVNDRIIEIPIGGVNGVILPPGALKAAAGVVMIVDTGGNFALNNLLVTVSNGETINGAPSLLLSTQWVAEGFLPISTGGYEASV